MLEPHQEVRAPRGRDLIRRHGEAYVGHPGQKALVLQRRRHLPARKVECVRLWPPTVN